MAKKKQVRDRATQKSGGSRGHHGRSLKTVASPRASGALADIYRAAAAIVTPDGEHQYSCNAISKVEGVAWGGPARLAYESSFASRCGYLFVEDVLKAGGYEWRITALGFAAAMADTGDLL